MREDAGTYSSANEREPRPAASRPFGRLAGRAFVFPWPVLRLFWAIPAPVLPPDWSERLSPMDFNNRPVDPPWVATRCVLCALLGLAFLATGCEDPVPPPVAMPQSAELSDGTNPDRDILAALYEATGGEDWTDNTNWLSSEPLDEWYGVETDDSGRVSRLDLGGNDLSGPIPPDLGQLTELRSLNLSSRGNSSWVELTGSIPPELGNLAKLELLDLSTANSSVRSDLTGPIPPELGDLRELRHLNLQQNHLDGSLPPELTGLANLRSLDLYGNELIGPIPPELGNLASLQFLDLSSNSLTGPIPPELGTLSKLTTLKLGGNPLTGSVPPELGSLSQLSRLWISHAGLTGQIPAELGALANLRFLSLPGNDLTGPIPPELGAMANLTILDLYDNELTGSIPPELGQLSRLWRLSLYHNGLTGPIPAELGMTGLQTLNLSDNDLTGPVPGELGNLSFLTRLNLARNRLTGSIPPELGQFTRLTHLSLAHSGLTGPIPPELGNLPELRSLSLGGSGLEGPIPRELGNLAKLAHLYLMDDLCLPGIAAFRHWFQGDSQVHFVGQFCAPGVNALRALYSYADGNNWSNSSGWLGVPILEDWYGVRAVDSLGRVLELDLSDNGLSGKVPPQIGQMTELVALRLDGNELTGRLPMSLTGLELQGFHYEQTGLCTPPDVQFRAWLESILDHSGTNVECGPMTDREVLTDVYYAAGGPNWRRDDNWLSDEPLDEWYGVETDDSGRVSRLDLGDNDLSGPIPPDLGQLAQLQELDLSYNRLNGSIPLELGRLGELRVLVLSRGNLRRLAKNRLVGPIPPELGNLGNLELLALPGGDLSGAIPPELGNLSKLRSLDLSNNRIESSIPLTLGRIRQLESLRLSGNRLTGPIGSELGQLGSLEELHLGSNSLTGAIPPEFGQLSNLRGLYVDNNDLTGRLPGSMTALSGLKTLAAGNTGLCVPLDDPAVQTWLRRIRSARINACERAAFYLTQAVQSRNENMKVPLVAGEAALLRVFLVGAEESDERFPNIRVRLFLDGDEAEVIDITNGTILPIKVEEADLRKSANVVVPGNLVKPSLEVVIEVDSVDAALGVPRRIPAEGRIEVPVYEMPALDLTLIPFLWSADPDSSIIPLVAGMADDSEDHELLKDTRTLLPVGALEVTAHESVTIDSNSAFDVLYATNAIRAVESGSGHYMGMMPRFSGSFSGVAHAPGWVSASGPYSFVIAHELGHNMSLLHSPCGSPSGIDPLFPGTRGQIGSYGYDFATGVVVYPERPDLMSYCEPEWISGYSFGKAMEYRIEVEMTADRPPQSARLESLLVWGGADSLGHPHLNPAFVVDAPPVFPNDNGDHLLRVFSDNGRVLFSLSFDMPKLADAGDLSAFAFVLPTDPAWAGTLAEITLSGPGGSVTMDAQTNRPAAMVWNPTTGQVRALLIDLPQGILTSEDAAALLSVGPILDLRFSRGVPLADAWRRPFDRNEE